MEIQAFEKKIREIRQDFTQNERGYGCSIHSLETAVE
jgi:hypothetical protein